MLEIAILAIAHRDLVSTDVKKPTQTGHKNYRSCFDDRPRAGVVKHTLTQTKSGVNYCTNRGKRRGVSVEEGGGWPL